jgi:hypothetical protein
VSNFQGNRKKAKIKKPQQPPPNQPQFKQKDGILTGKNRIFEKKKFYFEFCPRFFFSFFFNSDRSKVRNLPAAHPRFAAWNVFNLEIA